jgi:hypothetical protein
MTVADVNLISSVKKRLGDDDNWSPMTMINSVRRGAGDSAAVIGSGTPNLDASHISNPSIVTPVVLQSGDKRQVCGFSLTLCPASFLWTRARLYCLVVGYCFSSGDCPGGGRRARDPEVYRKKLMPGHEPHQRYS